VSTSVVLVRGRQANAWELASWQALDPRFEVKAVIAPNNLYPTDEIRCEAIPVRTLSSMAGPAITKLVGERFIGLRPHLSGADIVHSAEIASWMSAQAARAKRRLGYKLVVTVWETLPLLRTGRNLRTRRHLPRVLDAADLLLATTERARRALLLEGADPERIMVCSPGVAQRKRTPRSSEPGPTSHVVLSVGRLVWEKGHQDVLRGLALLGRTDVLLRIVGDGPERRRLERLAHELGIESQVDLLGSVPHRDMAALYDQASCLVLASLTTRTWEEQFGMVLIEAMAAGLPIVASASGAIPEVLRGCGALFPPGDWPTLATLLGDVLSGRPGGRVEHPREVVAHYSIEAAARRIAAAYERVL
jgi:glycosyltransferase involved in cell wall biosynthesis